MRLPIVFLSSAALSALSAPVSAQSPATPPVADIQRELADPANAETLTRMLDGMSDALLDLPVGELKAAAEGRQASPAERSVTVRDLGRRDDPNFERRLKADLANSGETMKAGMKAMAAALPAMMEGLSKAAEELDKATANLPSPAYPKR
jgi:hypothetical protein